MRVLVTGAEGFVGRWLTRALLRRGHTVLRGLKEVQSAPDSDPAIAACPSFRLDLTDAVTIAEVLAYPVEAIVHLAAVASGAEARRDPVTAWTINAVGTARLAEALGQARLAGKLDPLLLFASTGEVYGARATRPSSEDDPVSPCSPYAASKGAAEFAVRDVAGRTGLRAIVARPFSQIGPGQDERFFVPALAHRLLLARRLGETSVKVGSLTPVRDFIDVRDAAEALADLLERGLPGATYNVSSGRGVRLSELSTILARLVGVQAAPQEAPELMRPSDLPYLVGNPDRVRAATGWTPAFALETTLADVVADICSRD